MRSPRHLRDIELADGASSSRVVEVERSTIDGVVVVEDTTKGVPTNEGASSEQLDPPAC